jgi:hypothetical protein
MIAWALLRAAFAPDQPRRQLAFGFGLFTRGDGRLYWLYHLIWANDIPSEPDNQAGADAL